MPRNNKPIYGQVVIGPPGAGKTTYCNGMQQYLRLLKREAWVVNMDPANEGFRKDEDAGSAASLPYDTIFDICSETIDLSSVMSDLQLGPNGGLIYCMEYLDAHATELIEQLKPRLSKDVYLLFDFPGQVELYTHSTCVKSLLQKLQNAFDLRLTAVQLVDSHYCADAKTFISAALLGTTSMLRLELPTVSVLSKIDLVDRFGELPMNFDYFTDCAELERLVPFIDSVHTENTASNTLPEDDIDYVDDPKYVAARQRRKNSVLSRKHLRLHSAIAEVVDDFSLLGFLPLDISNAASVGRVLAKVDKCNGYVFTEASVNEDLFQCAIQTDTDTDAVLEIRERLSSSDFSEKVKR